MKKLLKMSTALFLAAGLTACNIQPNMETSDEIVITSDISGLEVSLRDARLALGLRAARTFDARDQFWTHEVNQDRNDMMEQAIESAKTEAILLHLAREAGIEYNADDVEQMRLEANVMAASLASVERTAERAFFETYFVTIDEYMEAFKNMTMIQQYIDMVIETLEVDDEDVRMYFNLGTGFILGDDLQIDVEASRAAFMDSHLEELNDQLYNLESDMYRVMHILIGTEDTEATDEEREAIVEEARAVVDSIFERAMFGADFAELAQEYSQDPGLLGSPRGYDVQADTPFVQEFLDWTFSAEVGDTGVIETGFGFHIMRLVYVLRVGEELPHEVFEELDEAFAQRLVWLSEDFDEEIEKLRAAIKEQITVNNHFEDLLENFEVTWTTNPSVFDLISPINIIR